MDVYPIDYERIVQEVYQAILRPSDIALDVGANVGRHSLPMARCVAPGGKVYAFEPLPECRQNIEAELAGRCRELADILTVRPEALAAAAGEAPFFVAEDALFCSGFRAYDFPLPTRLRRITVAVQTIDNLFLGLPSLRYLKVDAEGADLHVLRGGRAVLHKFRPAVSFEFGTATNRQGEVAPAEMVQFWHDLGYKVYAIDGRVLDEADFVENARREQTWDYVAVPAEDTLLDRTVCETLRQGRVNWLALKAWLGQAKVHAPVGVEVPPLRRFRGPLWPVARLAARLILSLARIVTGPQREFNQAVVHCLHRLTEDLERTEEDNRRRGERLRDLEQRCDGLERELARVRQEHQQTLEQLEEKLAGLVPEQARRHSQGPPALGLARHTQPSPGPAAPGHTHPRSDTPSTGRDPYTEPR